MIPRDRVLAALQHKEPDIVPWGEHWIDFNVYEHVLGRPSFVHAKFRETKALWEGRRDEIVASYKKDVVDLVDALEMDIIVAELMPSANEAVQPLDRVDEETYRDEVGNLYRISSATHDLMPYRMNPDAYERPTLESVMASIDEIDRCGVSEPHDSRWEVVRHIVRERKATHFVATFWDDFTWPSFGQTDEDFYVNLVLHPEMHEAIAAFNGKKAIAGLKYVAKEGVDAIITPGDMGSSTGPLASPVIYRKYVLPWHKMYVEEAHKLGLIVLKHCCGMVWDFIEDFVEIGYDAYEGIQTSAGMDMRSLKERVGDKLTLWGGVTNENLIHGSPDDVANDACYSLRWGAPGGGFVYGASHSLAVGTKPENLTAMKAAREKWGGYPILV